MRTILILDDETAVRESFADYFEDQLWNVIQASNAEDAIGLLEHETVQVAIVDVRLPGIDGNEFIRRMCEKRGDIAFIICTGSPEYAVPTDLLNIPCVSNTLMKKPLSSFSDLKELVYNTIHLVETRETDDS